MRLTGADVMFQHVCRAGYAQPGAVDDQIVALGVAPVVFGVGVKIDAALALLPAG